MSNRRAPAVHIVLGLSISILFASDRAFGSEGVKTRVIVERQAHFVRSLNPLQVYLNGEHVGEVSSGGVLEVERVLSTDEVNTLKADSKWFSTIPGEIHFVPDIRTVRFRVSMEVGFWKNRLKLEALSGTLVGGAGSLPRITLADKTTYKKIASEEYRAVEGFTIQLSRSSTWERGVSVSQTHESLREAGIDLKILQAKIGERVADMLAADIREATTAGASATIDGNVWEMLRIDWYAVIRPGKASLEVGGVQREVVFEYIVGYKPVPVDGRRRKHSSVGPGDEDPLGSGSSDESTSSSAEQPRGRNPSLGNYR